MARLAGRRSHHVRSGSTRTPPGSAPSRDGGPPPYGSSEAPCSRRPSESSPSRPGRSRASCTRHGTCRARGKTSPRSTRGEVNEGANQTGQPRSSKAGLPRNYIGFHVVSTVTGISQLSQPVFLDALPGQGVRAFPALCQNSIDRASVTALPLPRISFSSSCPLAPSQDPPQMHPWKNGPSRSEQPRRCDCPGCDRA